MATYRDFFYGANFAVWLEAIARIFEEFDSQRKNARNSIYLSTAMLSELYERLGTFVDTRVEPQWDVEVFREHLREVIQAYVYHANSQRGVQQLVAATTQIPPVFRPIQDLQRWILGSQYFYNRFFRDLDAFILSEVDEPYQVNSSNNKLIISVNGVKQTLRFPTGTLLAKDVIEFINKHLIGARAYPWGKRFVIETLETTIGGSILVDPTSTSIEVFGLDTHNRVNAFVPGGTGVLPFGWALSGDYLWRSPETPLSPGMNSQPIYYDGAIGGFYPIVVEGTKKEPFVGLILPIFLKNGGFEDNFEEWYKPDGPDFYLNSVKQRSGKKSLSVKTKIDVKTDKDGGNKTVIPRVNTIFTDKKYVPENSTVIVSGYHAVEAPGLVYASPPSPPTVFEWTVSNTVYGYTDQQFGENRVLSDNNRETVRLYDPSTDFVANGVRVGMGISVQSGANIFTGTIISLKKNELIIDQWQNGSNFSAHIENLCAPGSNVVYTSNSVNDPSKNFTTLGVQTGPTFKTRDKIRINQKIEHLGEITSIRQTVRDILAVATTVNPNDTLIVDMGWGSAPTPLSPTLLTAGNPYSVYIRPLNGSAYVIYHSVNELPAYTNFASTSANIIYTVKFYDFSENEISQTSMFYRPEPNNIYEQFSFNVNTPRLAETVRLSITVQPDSRITENIPIQFDTPIRLSFVPKEKSEQIIANNNNIQLQRGALPNGDYTIDYTFGTITFLSGSKFYQQFINNLVPPLVSITYDFEPHDGAVVSIDDIEFQCREVSPAEFHVSTDNVMQKIVFEDKLQKAHGVLTYTTFPQDGDTVTIGTDTYEFDAGKPDTGTITYTGQPTDGNTVIIGSAIYEFDNNCAVAPGHIVVFIDSNEDLTFTNLKNAINATSSLVSASIDTLTNTVTVAAKINGVSSPSIDFGGSGTNYTVHGSFLTGGVNPGDDVLPTHIGVPITNVLDLTYENLFHAINQTNTKVSASFDSSANQITVTALIGGRLGNDIVFTKPPLVTAYTLTGSGTLINGGEINATGYIQYSGLPNDGDTLVVGPDTYEFDSNGIIVSGNRAVYFNPAFPPSVAYETLAEQIRLGGVVTVDHDVTASRLTLRAIERGVAGNSILFSESVTNAFIVPTGGTLSGAINGEFDDPQSLTCTEVRDYINARANGFVASCTPDGRIRLTSTTTGLRSTLAFGHGSANDILGFRKDYGKINTVQGVHPVWRLTNGSGNRFVAVTNAVVTARKFWGTVWTARFWLRSSSPTAKAHIVAFFQDDVTGDIYPQIEDNSLTGTVTTSGTSVTGSGTTFTTELQVGDLIAINRQVRQIVNIFSSTSLQVDIPFSPNITTPSEATYQKYTVLDPTVATLSYNDDSVIVGYSFRDFGQFNTMQVRLYLFDLAPSTVIDVAFPYLLNDISRSLHIQNSTIPRNKQREHRLYRMIVANPDTFTETEKGLIGLNTFIEQESLKELTDREYLYLKKKDLFPFSESVYDIGLPASGTIAYFGQPNDGNTITVAYKTFEFDSNSIVTPGNVPVTIGSNADVTYQNFVIAVNTISPHVIAEINTNKTVTIRSRLIGTDGNSFIFTTDIDNVKITPQIGFLQGGRDRVDYTRGEDYVIRYPEGQIRKTPQSKIFNTELLYIDYYHFPSEVSLNKSYPQSIKPAGVKIEPDQTCLFFFRGRTEDFTHPDASLVNFEVVTREPDRFSYLRPVVRGFYTQVVQFTPTPPHQATLSYAAMVNQPAFLTKIKGNTYTTIPFGSNGWSFVSQTTIDLSTSTVYLRPGEPALFEPDAQYEFSYYVKFQFETAPIAVTDPTSPYVLLPYSYVAQNLIETKEETEQILFFNENRLAKLKLPAIMDQSLCELSVSIGGKTTIVPESQWQFVDEYTVEVFLVGFDTAGIYKLKYRYSKLSIVTDRLYD